MDEKIAWVFRGLIAPASLKHFQPAVKVFCHSRFPGLDCPGLIEASLLISSSLVIESRFSGA